MSKKEIEKYIPTALQVLQDEFSSGKIPSAYNGYISSFGASIIQSGLLPTLALFENKNANTKEDKEYLTKIILKVLDKDSSHDSLLHYVLDDKRDQEYLKKKIVSISVAIKLSLRTFQLQRL